MLMLKCRYINVCCIFPREWKKQPGGWKQKTKRWTTKVKDVTVSSSSSTLIIWTVYILNAAPILWSLPKRKTQEHLPWWFHFSFDSFNSSNTETSLGCMLYTLLYRSGSQRQVSTVFNLRSSAQEWALKLKFQFPLKICKCCFCLIRSEPEETSSLEDEDSIIPDSPVMPSSLPVVNKLKKRKNTHKVKHVRYAEMPLQQSNNSLFNGQSSLKRRPPSSHVWNGFNY